MKINSLSFKNFRCFENLKVSLNKDLNVFVGNNGAGKTTILDGIVCTLEDYALHAFGQSDNTLIAPKDLHMNEHGGFEEYSRVSVQFSANKVAGKEYQFHSQNDLENSQSDIPQNTAGLWKEEISTRNKIRHNPNTPENLCIYAYYKSTRNIQNIQPPNINDNSPSTRFDSIKSASNAFSQYQVVVSWLYQTYVDELFRREELGDSSYKGKERITVTKAVSRMIPQVTEIGFTQKNPRRLYLNWQIDETRVEKRFVSQLSDGYRNMLALVMDFARRLVQANPHLEDPLDAEAILLIDEIDLHLHPKWQQNILSDLKRTFPNTQIICTTHSPQVLSTVKPESILILEGDEVITAKGHHSYGVQSNVVLNDIMGVPARPDIPELEEQKDRLLSKINATSSKLTLDDPDLLQLQETLGTSDPFIINTKAAILRLKTSP